MAIALASLLVSGEWNGSIRPPLKLMGDIQLFITLTAWLQYWCIFSAIGVYRRTILRRPSLSLQARRLLIQHSIWVGWLISCVLSLVLTLSFQNSVTIMNWNAFRQHVSDVYLNRLAPLSVYQSVVLFIIFTGFVIGAVIIVTSYYLIVKTLYVVRPLCNNKVTPWVRTLSLSSHDNDLMVGVRRSYRPVEADRTKQPFTVSNGRHSTNCTVHFQKRNQSISMDISALENPLKKDAIQPERQRRCSNSSRAVTSQAETDFTDISSSGQLQRFQSMSNTRGLRRDQSILGGATKNSLMMVGTYLLLSLPILVCSIPRVLQLRYAEAVSLPLLFSRLIFFMNAPAYPIWYLLFSRRVRKCLRRLYSRIKVRIRHG